MTVIFLGTDAFGLPCLDVLHKHHQLLAVVTTPDRPQGRGYRLLPSPVKQWAQSHGVETLQPEQPDVSFAAALAQRRPDFLVVASYGRILPAPLLAVPARAPLNVHPSLLPKYRGAAPMEWALINGETETGISIFRMEPGIDTGDLLAQESLLIDVPDTIFTLREKLMRLAPPLLLRAIEAAPAACYQPQAGIPSYARKLTREDGRIDWGRTADGAHNLIRGVLEWPGAHAVLPTPRGPRLLKIGRTAIGRRAGELGLPGTVIAAGPPGIEIACGTGSLLIERLQMEGRKMLDAADFLRGIRVPLGTVLAA